LKGAGERRESHYSFDHENKINILPEINTTTDNVIAKKGSSFHIGVETVERTKGVLEKISDYYYNEVLLLTSSIVDEKEKSDEVVEEDLKKKILSDHDMKISYSEGSMYSHDVPEVHEDK